MPVDRSNLKGAVFALVAFALYATHDAFIKTLGNTFAPFQIVFFSTLLSFPMVTLMLMRDQTSGTLIPVHPWWTALRTVCSVIIAGSAFYAFSNLPLAEVYAILFAAPMLITVLSIPILGERVGIHRWAAVIVGLIGVMIVLRPGAAELNLGHAAALTASVGSSLVAVIIRKIGRDERSAVLLLYPMMANALVMGAILPFVYVPVEGIHFAMFAAMSALGFIAGLLIIAAYKSADAAIVAPMQYSQLVWAAVFGYAFFAEFPDVWTWVGAAVIIASGLYIVLRESLRGATSLTPVLTDPLASRHGHPPACQRDREAHRRGRMRDLPNPGIGATPAPRSECSSAW
jgi:S-adenosylmethionine uptake transporter